MGSEKHDVAVIVLNDPGIMDRCDSIGHIVPGENRIPGVSFNDVCGCRHRLSGNNSINIYKNFILKPSKIQGINKKSFFLELGGTGV
jgi:hypothetical protein